MCLLSYLQLQSLLMNWAGHHGLQSGLCFGLDLQGWFRNNGFGFHLHGHWFRFKSGCRFRGRSWAGLPFWQWLCLCFARRPAHLPGLHFVLRGGRCSFVDWCSSFSFALGGFRLGGDSSGGHFGGGLWCFFFIWRDEAIPYRGSRGWSEILTFHL